MKAGHAGRCAQPFMILSGIALVVAAVGAENESPIDRGKRIYQSRCVECHGVEGRGDGERAPSLSPRPGSLVSAATSAKSDRELLRTIQHGKPRTAMPAWKDVLTEEEIGEVLRYLRSLVRFSRPLTPMPPSQ